MKRLNIKKKQNKKYIKNNRATKWKEKKAEWQTGTKV